MFAIPEKFADLCSFEKKAFAFLALVKQDGTPQVTPIWFDYDGTHIIINTARGRVKDKILKRHPVVALAIQDPANAYRYIQVRGKVVDETEVGGYEQNFAGTREHDGIGKTRKVSIANPSTIPARPRQR
jgi:PPOX class probable F420-dependent enzyme